MINMIGRQANHVNHVILSKMKPLIDKDKGTPGGGAPVGTRPNWAPVADAFE